MNNLAENNLLIFYFAHGVSVDGKILVDFSSIGISSALLNILSNIGRSSTWVMDPCTPETSLEYRYCSTKEYFNDGPFQDFREITVHVLYILIIQFSRFLNWLSCLMSYIKMQIETCVPQPAYFAPSIY